MGRPKKGETGCKEANDKWRKTVAEKYGSVTEFMREVGRKGGSKSHPETRPFTTNPKLASVAGTKGGKSGKRGPARKPRSDKGAPRGPRNKAPQAEEIKTEVDDKKKGLFGWFLGRKNG